VTATATSTPTVANTPTPTVTYTPAATVAPANTATYTPSLTPTVSATATSTPTMTATATATQTNTPTRTPTVTSTGTPTVPPTLTAIWGTAQTISTGLSVANPANSIDGAFNNLVATSSNGQFARQKAAWTMTSFQTTTLSSVISATVLIRFNVTGGYVDDPFTLDLSPNGGANWTTVQSFGQGGVNPPTSLTTLSFNVSSLITTPAQANQVQVRLQGQGKSAGPDTFQISLDETELQLAGQSALGSAAVSQLNLDTSGMPLVSP
jgi:hypothetical protein